jgi:hypothetical protein
VDSSGILVNCDVLVKNCDILYQMCVILELLFLSYYCDYIVVEIAVFAFLSKKSLKLLIFGSQMGATENNPGKISAARAQSPKIAYFWRSAHKSPKISYFQRLSPAGRKVTFIFCYILRP